MSMEPYPEYKESGVKWLGEIPVGWRIAAIKVLCSFNDEVLPETTDPDYQFHYVEISDVSHTEGITFSEPIKFANAASRARRVVREGDVLVSTVRTYLRAIAGARSIPCNTIASTGFAVLRPRNCDARFLAYGLLAEHSIGEIIARSVGISYPAINATDLVNVKLPVPEQNEQHSIADYLDRETSEIDAFIADQEELITLLEERRTATISAKTFPYKTSPDDSNHAPLVRVGQAFSESDDRVESASPAELLSVSIHSGVLPWSELHDKEPKSETLKNYKIVMPGDIVLNRMRAFQGGLGESKNHGVVSPDYMVMRIRKNANSSYLSYLMKSHRFIAEMSSRLRGIGSEEQGTVRTPRINPRDLSNIRVPLPPLKEQQEIAAYLDRETAEIDAAITDAREAIALSKERRAAVISAAVTGKIDVRGLTTEPTPTQEQSVGVA
ncbi:restriction endonuclease subunit S [Glutamicibacter uratoxydans]|uniref:restriction endonuclease subunit S n=1 Tax=Glutamicibacter uratoxydans TaxID=43667 RepID=UPI003D6E28E2